MKKEDFQQALTRLRNDSPKRNFNQSVECIVTLKGLNLKKPEEQLDAFVSLPNHRGKQVKVAAFVGAELTTQSKKSCQLTILDQEFSQFEGDKKKLKSLADGYDFFLGQATLMPSIAKVFGRVLGPKGKMPNPKAGCVVPPNAVLGPLVDRLQKTVRVQAKTMPMVQVVVGNQSMSDAELLDNVMAVYNQVVHGLPGEENNVRAAILKYSMGPPIKIGAPAQSVKTAEKATLLPGDVQDSSSEKPMRIKKLHDASESSKSTQTNKPRKPAAKKAVPKSSKKMAAGNVGGE